MKCHMLGRLTRDVELKYTASGVALATFGMAENYYTGSGDNRKEFSNFFEFQAWDKQAENLSKFVKKGDQLYVESDAKQDTWEDKDSGQKRSKVVFVVRDFKLVGSKSSATADEEKVEPTKEKAKTKSKEQPKATEEVPF